jgi:FkbM family methyltransferase
MIKQLYSTAKFILTHPLIKKNKKWDSLVNFILWQIGVRALSKKVIVPWVEDSRLIVGLGETGATGNIYTGFAEYQDILFLLHALQPEEKFVDIGANIGVYTILASKVIRAKSISFEPIQNAFDRFEDQVKINRINHLVRMEKKGVGEKSERLFFMNDNDTVNKVSLIGDVANTTEIEVIALDDVLKKNEKYFIKIDVEGFEYKVILGAKDTLSSPNTVGLIIELNGSSEEFGSSNSEIHNKLLSFNFYPVSYDPISRSLVRISEYNKNGGNTIYIKDIEMIAGRCKNAPKRRVNTIGIEI